MLLTNTKRDRDKKKSLDVQQNKYVQSEHLYTHHFPGQGLDSSPQPHPCPQPHAPSQLTLPSLVPEHNYSSEFYSRHLAVFLHSFTTYVCNSKQCDLALSGFEHSINGLILSIHFLLSLSMLLRWIYDLAFSKISLIFIVTQSYIR